MSYTQTEPVSITQTLSVTNIEPDFDMSEKNDVIVDTGRRTISLLRTIGTIVVVMMLLF